jgi:D-glycero-D-manno-heptose 1,7-bisphosphate phosphatase
MRWSSGRPCPVKPINESGAGERTPGGLLDPNLEGRTLESRFVLLDRDGVINRRIAHGYVTSWSQFRFLPGVLDGLKRLAMAGYSGIVVSNQAGVGKGLMEFSTLDQITRRFIRKVRVHGGLVRRAYYCTHRKQEHCSCRKPRPGLLFQAQADYRFSFPETYLIGDSLSDLTAATQAGCPMILVKANSASLLKTWAHRPRFVVPDFRAAVNAVLTATPQSLNIQASSVGQQFSPNVAK